MRSNSTNLGLGIAFALFLAAGLVVMSCGGGETTEEAASGPAPAMDETADGGVQRAAAKPAKDKAKNKAKKFAPAQMKIKAVTADDLQGTWVLENFAGHGVADGVETTIVFGMDGTVSGSGGCNKFTGSYTLEDDRLTFGPLAGTKMMCPEVVMEQEDGFMRALGAVSRTGLGGGGKLLIHTEGADQPLKFVKLEE